MQAYLHCRHSAGLLQRYTSRNSWHCDKTAVISSENRRSFSIRNNFAGPLSLFYAPPLASGVTQNRFQEHNPVLYLYELCIWPVKNVWGRPLVAGINWIINAKSTDIRQRSFAFYGPIVCRWTGWTVAENLSFWTVMNTTLGHRRIADEYCGGAAFTKFPTKYFRIELCVESLLCE